jgi:hypothetical protein
MHPCREYWGQDVAYGSLVNEERPRRVDRIDRAGATPEFYVLDVDAEHPADDDPAADIAPARSAHLAGLVQRLCEFGGDEASLRQSAAHLKEYLHSARSAACRAAGVRQARPAQDVRILGIAGLHRAGLRHGPPGEAPPLEADAASEQLCAGFLRRLAALGEARDVARIDWILVRVVMDASATIAPRSHIGATTVARVNLQPLEA